MEHGPKHGESTWINTFHISLSLPWSFKHYVSTFRGALFRPTACSPQPLTPPPEPTDKFIGKTDLKIIKYLHKLRIGMGRIHLKFLYAILARHTLKHTRKHPHTSANKHPHTNARKIFEAQRLKFLSHHTTHTQTTSYLNEKIIWKDHFSYILTLTERRELIQWMRQDTHMRIKECQHICFLFALHTARWKKYTYHDVMQLRINTTQFTCLPTMN